MAILGTVSVGACGPSSSKPVAKAPAAHVPTPQEVELATQIRVAKENLEHDLYDASSVRYRNVVRVLMFHYDRQGAYPAGDAYAFCGEINAKNRFGAYVGFRRFDVIASKTPDPGAANIETPDGLGPIGWLAFCKGKPGTPVQF